jgi:hypothetical protein
MRARIAHDVGQHEGHAGELHAEQLEPLPLSPTLARDARHAVRSAPMLALTTTSTSSPARLKTRVGGSTSPRALRVGKFHRQPRGPHRETTTRARRFAVGSRKYLSPEPLLQSPDWVASQLRSGRQVAVYAYAFNNPIGVVDPTGLDGTVAIPWLVGASSTPWLAYASAGAVAVGATGLAAFTLAYGPGQYADPPAGIPYPYEAPFLEPVDHPISEPGMPECAVAASSRATPEQRRQQCVHHCEGGDPSAFRRFCARFGRRPHIREACNRAAGLAEVGQLAECKNMCSRAFGWGIP